MRTGERPRVVRLADHRVVPWKNGRGFTTELAVEPPGAGLGDFDWRISVARIDEDGPFSSFPGVDRTLLLLDGAGVDLETPDRAWSLDRRWAVARFPGEAPVRARLHAGPVTDLNVMVRRAAWSAAVAVVEAPAAPSGPEPTIAVALSGAPEVAGHELAPTEAVVAPGPVALGGRGAVLVVRLTPVRG